MSIKPKPMIAIAVILAIAVTLAIIQMHHDRQAETSNSGGLPPDMQAYYGTYAIKEPEKRLGALEKFIADFPESSQIRSAYGQIFILTIEIWPDDRAKMLKASAAAETIEDAIDRSLGYQFIAKELFKAKLFLEDAEIFASKSISLLDKDLFIKEMAKVFPADGKPAHSDSELHEQYLKELAQYRTTLGRIYLEEGRFPEGEKILQEANSVDPLLAQAAIGLAQIAESRGENAKALDYLTTAALTAGDEMEDARNRIETLYRKTHDDSIDGLEPMLDEAYRKLLPNPVEVEPYQPTETRSNRVVLAEFFTGAG